MLPASWICVVTLASAQVAGEEFATLPPIDDSAAVAPYDWNQTPPGFAGETFELPATRLTAAWLASGGADGFGVTDFDCNHTWLLGYDDLPPLTITPGLGLHLWSGPQGLDLPARVYDVYLDFSWRPIDAERWGLSLGITPGWYGDFERLDGDTFQLTGWMLGNYRMGPHWNVLGGLAYVRQLRSHLLPVGGLVWTPNEDTRLELIIPKPRLVRRFHTDETGSTYWYVAGQFGGGAWAVADDPATNVLVGYSDLRVLVGIEGFRLHGREWYLEAGYVFARDLSVDGDVAHSPADTFLLQASFAF
jgi:hypothetical protein